MSMLAAVQCGAHFILHSAGWLEGGLTMGYEKFIMDADFCAALHVWMRGLQLDDNQLALDAFRGRPRQALLRLRPHARQLRDGVLGQRRRRQQFLRERRDEGMKEAPTRAAQRLQAPARRIRSAKLHPAVDEELADFVRRRKAERPMMALAPVSLLRVCGENFTSSGPGRKPLQHSATPISSALLEARPAEQDAGAALSNVVIAFETEEAARCRLEAFGYEPEIAAEIAVYLAQSSDLPLFVDEIGDALRRDGIAAEFVALDELAARLSELAPRRDRTMVWALTDGVRFYRGSSVPALARLEGFARFGSPATAAHLCQDKFASLALASAAGLSVPPTRLMKAKRNRRARRMADLPARCSSSPIHSGPRSGFSPTACVATAGSERSGTAHMGAVSRPGARPTVRRRRRRAGQLHGSGRRVRRSARRRTDRQGCRKRGGRRLSDDEGQ